MIDHGITHSFVDDLMVKKIKVIVKMIIIFAIILGNESIMRCDVHNPMFIWFIQGYEFKVDLRIRILGYCHEHD